MMSRNRLPLLRVNIAIMAAIILGIMILINYLSAKHNVRIDTTASGKYTLSDQTLKVLKSLPDTLKLILFDKLGSNERTQAEDLLNSYKYHSDKLDIQYIDPDQQPLITTKYGVQRYNTLVLEFSGQTQQLEKISEEKLTNAIIKLTKGESKIIYFLTGHGEADIEDDGKSGYSMIKQQIFSQNYSTQKLLLMRETQIPADCDLLVVAGPKTAPLKEEFEAIKKYLDMGGNALFMLDPQVANKPETGFSEFLAGWGVKVGQDVIIDVNSQLFGGDYFMPVISKYAEHPISRDFNVASFFVLARSITPANKLPDDVLVQTLASTGGQNNWAESDLNGPYEYTEGKDQLGPVSVAVTVNNVSQEKKESQAAAEHTQDAKESPVSQAPHASGRMVVLGDSDFINNTYLNISGNRDFFLNTINWLAEEEDLISIRPKSDTPRTISLTAGQMRAVFYLSVVLLPVLAAITGTIVWFRRRKL
jgi:ABC-type uncharacterized transport system involved in gliding motility auxiliary subunit